MSASLWAQDPAALYVFALLIIRWKSASNAKRSGYRPFSNFACIVLRSMGFLMTEK